MMDTNELVAWLEKEKNAGWYGDFGNYLGKTTLVLKKLQAENDAIKEKYETDYAKAFENGYAIGLSHGKDLIANGKV